MADVNNITSSLFGTLLDIVKDETPTTNIANIAAMPAANMEESYFLASIGHIRASNIALREAKLKYYSSIAVAENCDYVLESCSDYFVKAESIISKAKEFLRNKLDGFFDYMESFMEDDCANIAAHKKDLTQEVRYFANDHFDGYRFSFSEDIPNMRALDNFSASLFDKLYKCVITDFSVEKIKEVITSIDLEEDYRKFRTELLGSDTPMSEQEFVRNLVSIYRDGQMQAQRIDINAKYVRDIAEEWFDFKSLESMLNAQYKMMEQSCDSVMKRISTICKSNNGLSVSAFTNLMPGDIQVKSIDGKDIDANGAMMSGDMMVQLDIYCNAKLTQLQKYTDYIIMAMTAKMDAIKAMYNQYKYILMRVLEVMNHKDLYYDPMKAIRVPTNAEDILDGGDGEEDG